MASKKRLLFLTTDLPFPPSSGGTIKSFRLLEFLSQHYDVEVICTKGKSERQLSGLRNSIHLIDATAFDIKVERNGFTWLKSLFAAPTFNAFRNQSDELKSEVDRASKRADIILADHLEVVHLIPDEMNQKLVYHSHNAESRLWHDMADRALGALQKMSISHEAQRVAKHEQKVIERSRLTFAAPNDIEYFTTEFKVNKNKLAITYHLGRDELLELPEIDLNTNRLAVFYAGTLSWEPNSNGLKWLLRKVWPEVIAKLSDAELIVCGKGADEELNELLKTTSGVQYKGFVDDLEIEMKQCRAAVVPLLFGSGMKIKTFDALYRGLPLITTSVGAEGIEIESGKHALVADSEADFARQIANALSEDHREMARNGRGLMSEKYTYEKLFQEMLEKMTNSL